MDKHIFTKEDTHIMKGIAIALMLIHHIARFNNRIVDNIIPISLTKINDIDMAYYLGIYGKTCVSIFYLCGGIGIYKTFQKGKLDIFNRIFKLYLSYWKVFIIFVPIGFLFFNNQPDYCESTGICHRYENFDIIELISNFIGLSNSYNSEWYFLKYYVVILLIFWMIGGVLKRHSFTQNVFWIIIYDIILEAVFPTFSETILFKNLQKNYLFSLLIYHQVPYVACFWMGCALAKDDILEKLRFELQKKKLLNTVVDIYIT